MKPLLPRVVDCRGGELPALIAAFTGFFFLLCGYYLLRPLRDAMAIAGGAGQLQWLFSATFLSMLALVPVYGWVVRRLPPERFIPLVFRFFALNILLFAALFAFDLATVAVGRVFFVWLSVYNVFVVSVFWSALVDRFNSEQGTRLFGFIAAGGTAGALAGPAFAAWLAPHASGAWLALLAALLLEACVRCYRLLTAHTQAGHAGDRLPLGGAVLDGLRLLLQDRYLRAIALWFLLHSVASTFLYLEQARLVEQQTVDTGSRIRLFALVDLAVSCSTILVQIFLTARLLRRFGVAAALAALPLVGALVFLAVAAAPALATVALAQAVRRATDYAIARPARELLFTVVSREAKYKAKSAIETVVYRGGDASSGWLFAAASAAGAGFATLAGVMLPVSLGWAALSVWLARRHDASGTVQSAADLPGGK